MSRPRRRLAESLVSIVVLSLLAAPVRAWGPVEHRAVARVAQERLSAQAQRRIRLLFGKTTKLEDLATWADEILAERPETEPWRSITIPPGATALDLNRDCPLGDCVTAKIREFVGVTRLALKEKSKVREAFQFLVSLVADLHQPLHAGYPPGRGGDPLAVVFSGDETTLYELWESGLAAPGEDGADLLAERLRRRIASSSASRWSAGSLKDWTWESHLVAVRLAYGALPEGDVKKLDESYLVPARESAEEQLAKAAVRLAQVISRIWP